MFIDKFRVFIFNVLMTPSNFRLDYLRSLVFPKTLTGYPLPWMNYKAIDYIKPTLSGNSHVFEYGSGSSTKYWVAHGCRVTSIEHDKAFYDQLSIEVHGKCDYIYIPPVRIESNIMNNPESPDLFHSSDYLDYSFESYVKYIDRFSDRFFDMVVVDGRARPSCIKRAMSKIKKGGVLVLDNSDRSYYLKETDELLTEWSRETFKGTVRGLLHHEQTTIFIKP